jgi:hypothetical protein
MLDLTIFMHIPDTVVAPLSPAVRPRPLDAHSLLYYNRQLVMTSTHSNDGHHESAFTFQSSRITVRHPALILYQS